MRSFLLLAFASSALAACSPFDPDFGGTSYKCGSVDPKCPDGYTCQQVGMDMRCVSDDGPGPDGGNNDGFVCAEDSFETAGTGGNNNDTTATPFSITMPTIAIGPVSLCPAGDKDTYKVEIVNANSNLAATTTWESGLAVNVSILNGGGSVIVPGTPDGDKSNKAYGANLPVGTYYVQVSAAATVKNNYRLSVMVTQ
jgi:hypothetical protein